MDLKTKYMGLNLKNPLVAAASPLSQQIDNLKKMEDAGISAAVMHSLFEEQITEESLEAQYFSAQGTDSFAEALSYFPAVSEYVLGPDEYLRHIAKAKESVDIPIIGSLNGRSVGGWIDYAQQIQDAGADALELNIYFIPTDPVLMSAHIEDIYTGIFHAVKENVTIPVAVKLNPYFSSMAHMAKVLDDAGADALVLFNRFYQPDIDLDTLDVTPNLILSSSYESRLPLRWIALLYGRLRASLAATSGVHRAEDVLKLLLAGADVTMLCSSLLLNGIDHATTILDDIEQWMEKHEYKSIQELRGSVSQKSCAVPEAFERANYMKVLQSFKKKL
jgi:dihydroorotate dehydrogenase (fumarate)